MNGRLVDFADAKIHAFSHVFHYGSAMFEGMRVYKTRNGPAAFRLDDHIDRLYHSCKVYRMDIPYDAAEFKEAIFDTIRANAFGACYVRPLIYRGLGALGVNPFKSPVDVIIAVWKWGQYLGDDAVENGVDVCVSSWNRMAPNTFPAMAKATGNYLNSMLIKMEAITNGYVEGIVLDANGFVSEGSGENLFLVRGGTLVTPPLAASLLPGITRDSIMTLARDLGIEVREEMVSRGQLYTCDEVFLTGTAAEITPVSSIDRYPVGSGCPGEVTRRLMAAFNRITAEGEDRHGWLSPVGEPAENEAALTAAEASAPV
jgi:branched-chain amino acid aminotransferase